MNKKQKNPLKTVSYKGWTENTANVQRQTLNIIFTINVTRSKKNK